jgi:four helix bundle protein
MKSNLIKEKTFAFSVRIVKLSQYLIATKKEFVISKQILKSGTSIGANVREAVNAESAADFVHKLSIAQKEADETLYWLELLVATDFLNQHEFDSMFLDGASIIKILKTIIITTKKNNRRVDY